MTGCNRNVPPLQRHAVLAALLSATATIGPEGGTIESKEAGITIDVPAGALQESVSLALTPRQDVHGFDVTMSPSRTLTKRVRVAIRLGEGVPTEGLVLGHVASDGRGCDEFYAAKVEHGHAVAYVPHFSGYILASGAAAGQACDPNVVTDGTCVWVDDNPT